MNQPLLTDVATAHAPSPRAGSVVKADQTGTIHPLYPSARLLLGGHVRAMQVQEEAALTLKNASVQAAAMIEEARDRVAQIEAAATARAREQAAGKLNELIANVETTVRTWTEDQSRQMAHAAVRLAGTILRSELTRTPERIAELAAQTLARARHESVAALEMSPQDAALATEALEQISQAARYAGGLRIVANESLPRGSVRLHTTQGMYDGSLATRLGELERLLSGSGS